MQGLFAMALSTSSSAFCFSKSCGRRNEIWSPSHMAYKQHPSSLCEKLSLQTGHMTNSLRRSGSQCYSLAEQKSTFSVGNKFQLDDVIEAQQFDRDILNEIFNVAREMELIEKNSPGSKMLRGFLMATLFYEPSTRTRLSFESAMKRLGGEVLTTENAREFSSAAKGETLEGML